jgi:hypothetical protein
VRSTCLIHRNALRRTNGDGFFRRPMSCSSTAWHDDGDFSVASVQAQHSAVRGEREKF